MAIGKFVHEAGLPVDPSSVPDRKVEVAVKKFLERRAREQATLAAEQKTAERTYYQAKALKNK